MGFIRICLVLRMELATDMKFILFVINNFRPIGIFLQIKAFDDVLPGDIIGAVLGLATDTNSISMIYPRI